MTAPMDRIKFRIPLCAMAVVMLAVSCVRLQEDMSSLPALPISWRTVETKAASPFPQDRTFISYAWLSLPDGETWSDGSNEPHLYIDGAEISYHDADGWHADSPFFWPPEGTLSFFSYAPSDMPEAVVGGSGVSVTQDGVKLDDWDVLYDDGSPKNIDFMVADPAKDLTAKGAAGGVPTLFRHTMTRVRVNIIDDGSSESEIVIGSITLNGIYCTGSYAAGSWGLTSTRSNLRDISLPLPATTTIGAGLRTDYVIMLPQNLLAVSDNVHGENRPAPSMTITYSNPSDPGITTANIEFERWLGSSYWTSGHDITYTVTFGTSTDPIGFDATVGDWTDIGGVTVSGQ